MIEGHTLAIVSIVGSSLNVLGSLYLAYDLLGGEHGPLRILTRGVTYGLIFGLGFGIGFGPFLFGTMFGVTFGALSTVGQVIGYRVGVRPSVDYAPSSRPRMSKLLFLAVLNRTVGYGIAGYVSTLIAYQRVTALAFGLKVGLLVGVVTAIVTFFLPFIEWRADHMPVRRMGVIGVVMILIGFAFQSVQYWVTLSRASVR